MNIYIWYMVYIHTYIFFRRRDIDCFSRYIFNTVLYSVISVLVEKHDQGLNVIGVY